MDRESFARAAEALRKSDRERYLATLVLNGAQREAVTALYAFNADVASIRDRVSEPAPGEMRLQWWDDALTGTRHGNVRQNPLADALLDTIAAYRIPVGTLQRLLGARRFDLYDDPMPDLDSFEGYAGETSATLYQLAAMVLNGGDPVEPGDAAGHLGVAHALIGHMRAFGFHAARGQIFLPWSVFAANGVREGEIFSGTDSEGLQAAFGQLQELARGHLDKARSAVAALPGKVRPAFAPLTLLEAELGTLEMQGTNPFSPPPPLPDWRRILQLVWWTWRNR